mgnify:CR=1 FL=1
MVSTSGAPADDETNSDGLNPDEDAVRFTAAGLGGADNATPEAEPAPNKADGANDCGRGVVVGRWLG